MSAVVLVLTLCTASSCRTVELPVDVPHVMACTWAAQAVAQQWLAAFGLPGESLRRARCEQGRAT